ncbi:MAG: hypothetical protein NVSMB70_13660 [Chamaesiphon sp.]
MKIKSGLYGDIQNSTEMIESDPKTIEDIHGTPISPQWQAEFRGFFWGEGMLTMQRTRKPNGNWGGFAVYCRITLRADDRKILDEFSSRLGGLVKEIRGPEKSKPVVQWQVSTIEECLRIAQLLENSEFSPRKARELNLWRACIELKKDKGLSHWRGEQLEFMRKATDELKQLKKWVE